MQKIKEKLSNALALPKEISLDLPLVTATGSGEVIVENYKNLIEFTDTKIRIRVKNGVIAINGEQLVLQQVTTECLLIAGRVSGISYE